MKPSPLQLEKTEYPAISVRANPSAESKLLDVALPVKVEASVFYELDGRHFARLSLSQHNKLYPYEVDIEAFTMFSIDAAGCAAAYKSAFNPGVIAANIARILYSGARELLAFVTSRAPYGVAPIESVIIEPQDVEIQFEENEIDQILEKIFSYSPEKIADLKERANRISEKPALEAKATEKQEKAKKSSKKKKAD